jgi:hypothetical protein
VVPASTSFSPVSRSLFVFRSGEIQARVFRLEVAAGRRTLWKEIRPLDVAVMGISGVHLTRDGRSGVYGSQRDVADLYIVNGLR